MREFMLGTAPKKQALSPEDAAFVEALESELNDLPKELKDKLQKLNFYSAAITLSSDQASFAKLKEAIIELLQEFMAQGYNTTCVSPELGYFVYKNEECKPRLSVFKEICDNNAPKSAPPVTPAFQSKLSITAKPFIPQKPNGAHMAEQDKKTSALLS